MAYAISIPFSTIKSCRAQGRRNTTGGISIPFSTIKSQFSAIGANCFIVFQFHLVRLKVIMCIYHCLPLLFQFHLVRLKAPPPRSASPNAQISIPFSTIKRKLRGTAASSPNISIPFSTIKSRLNKYINSFFQQFQFHLVRLKDIANLYSQKELKFQFHLVRLKAQAAEEDYASQIFQFHLVRLKVLRI